jgi:2-pyrone-4,6-dicarboxylate lactonase
LTSKPSLCDCHSHAYGPYARFPLAQSRAFEPPESSIETLEEVWQHNAVDRAVLIQGSAYETDHSALLHAIARDPERRRGIAILPPDVPQAELVRLHQCGVRGVRFNWVKHLRPTVTLDQAAILLHRVQPLGWHGEVHIDADLLEQAERLTLPDGVLLVIDHMARLDASLGLNQPLCTRLLRLLEREHIWVKLSGADRVAARCDSLRAALPFMKALIKQAPEKCVWGLDWPHVNLTPKRSDHELFALLQEAAPEEQMQRKIMMENPARLYAFPIPPPLDDDAVKHHEQGAAVA